MAMDDGWIKLYRCITEHWVWKDKPFSKGQAWIDILLLSNHDDSKFVFGNELIDVERGSFITSETKLSDRWGWSRHKVRDFLNLLESDSMLVKKSDAKRTSLKVLNYSVWQNSPTTKGQKKDSCGTAAGQLRDTNKNVKNVKNDKNKDIEVLHTSLSTEVDSTDRIPYQDIVNLYHSNCVSYPKLKTISGNRQKAISARWKQYKKNISVFDALFQKAEQSGFLKGANNRNWQADFNWLMNDANMAKVLEGKYDNRDKGNVIDPPNQKEMAYERAKQKADEMLRKEGIILE